MFARVVVLSSVRGREEEEPAFDYTLPDDLADRVQIGSLVTVPFGPRPLYGIVVDLPERPAVAETRPLTAVVDPEPVLTPVQIELARWMSRETLAPLHECFQVMLPPGVVGMTDSLLEVAEEIPQGVRLGPVERRLLALLQRRGPLRGGQLDQALHGQDWRSAAERLVRRGFLKRTPVLTPPAPTRIWSSASA